MHIGTVARYLVGDRQAILDVARNRHALWLGALFVLSAGFAREYDAEDLLHEPWHLALPFVASLGASFLLFLVVSCIFMELGAPLRPLVSHYLGFLGLFWMTAPLAWLYAVPYERFLSPAGAVQANLATLAVVAAWRVALMVRVLIVLFGYGPGAAIGLVVLFGNVLVMTAGAFGLPLVGIMGGLVDGPEGTRMVHSIASDVFALGLLSAPICLLLLLTGKMKREVIGRFFDAAATTATRPSRALVIVACVSVAGWAVVLPFTQREQQLRYRVERAVKEGRPADALAELSAHDRQEYPPHWAFPPRRWHTDTDKAQLLDVLESLLVVETPVWVRDAYLDKFRLFLIQARFGRDNEELRQRARRVLARLPEGPTLLAELQQRAPWVAERWLAPDGRSPEPRP
jgi:hypothetical protein